MSRHSNMKEQILLAVEDLIATKGANNFSLRDIADALDISTGSLYYHFKTKDEIILAILSKHFGMLEKEYIDWLERHRERGDLTKEKFIDTVIYKGTDLYQSYKIHIYLINECMRGNTAIRESYTRLLDGWYEKFVEGVRQVYGDREDARAVAYMLMLVIEGLTIRSALDDRAPEEENEMKSLLEEM